MKRVAVIGLDAMEPRIIEAMLQAGQLPHIAALRQNAATYPLRSEGTWRTGRVWETFLTGVADYPSAIDFDPQTYGTRQLGSRKRAPFYDDLPGSVVALDVPYISLAYPKQGAQVIWSGHDTGHPRAANPPGLLRHIDQTFGVHPAHRNDFNCPWHDKSAITSLTNALELGARRRVDIAKWLLDENPDWSLFMTVMSEAHSTGEFFWHGEASDEGHLLGRVPSARHARRCQRHIHRVMDECVGALVAAMPADTHIILTTVHGMETNHYDLPSMVLLPDLLYRAQFGHGLVPALPMRKNRVSLPMPWQRWYEYMQERFAPDDEARSHLTRTERQLRRDRGEPSSPIDALDTPIPPERELTQSEIDAPVLSNLDWQPAAWYRAHWPSMRAFALPVFYDGRVRINLRGRERDGTVDDYSKALDEVEDLLAACTSARTGGPVVKDAYRMRADDPYALDGPDADLLFTWQRGVDGLDHPTLGRIGPLAYRRSGGHTDRGLAFLTGPGITPHQGEERSALDLTPTLRALLGLATRPMDGKALDGIG